MTNPDPIRSPLNPENNSDTLLEKSIEDRFDLFFYLPKFNRKKLIKFSRITSTTKIDIL